MENAIALLFTLSLLVRSAGRNSARVRRRFRELACLLAMLGLAPGLPHTANASHPCGNGVVDAGEQCDPATDPCCASDCEYAAAGVRCADFECMDARCDGFGSCNFEFNDDWCESGDACSPSRCSEGECRATGTRQFREVRATFRVDDQGLVESAKIAALAPLDTRGDDPAEWGADFQATLGGAPAWDDVIPADFWIRKSPQTFVYRSTNSQPGRVRSAKVRFNADTGIVSYRIKLARPMISLLPALPTIFMLAGSAENGQCAASPLADCVLKGGTYSCQ